MGFTSLIFLFVFFPVCIAGYYLLIFLERKSKFAERFRLKDLFLILISIGFYGWAGMNGIPALCLYVLLIYCFGKLIVYGRERSDGKKRLTLGIMIAVLTAFLYYFKYTNFMLSVLEGIWNRELGGKVFWVPLGISFITFSAISYIIDVYRGDQDAGNLIDVALYLTFFPKIVSGPIVLWKDFKPQIGKKKVSVDLFVAGLNRIMIGFAKKLILADYFGTVVGQIQNQVSAGIDVPAAWGCAILYTLQIYYDFAGYSDVALGLSAMLGIEMKENFTFPYTSLSITEFWRNWHISLGTWFREYLYIPLGGNRKGKIRTLINLAVVWIVTGVWHGAGWNYIFWGMLHGAFVLGERCIKDKKFYVKAPKLLKWFITMFVVNLGWEAFRIAGIRELFHFYGIMFGMAGSGTVFFTWRYFFTNKAVTMTVIGILGAVVLKWKRLEKLKEKLDSTAAGFLLQEAVLFGLMIISVLCMVNSTYSPFIYFQY